MNRVSIKLRVTLWYAIFLLLVMGVTLTVIIYASDIYLVNETKSDTIQGVKEAYDEIEFEDGLLEIGEIDFLDNGVYISVYDVNKNKMMGYVPKGFKEEVGFKNNEMCITKGKNVDWYSYDEYISLDGYNDIWIRGIASGVKSTSAIRFMMLLCLIVFPILLIVAMVGGYLITKKAFDPVKRIRNTARAISGSRNLNSRIGLVGKRDEIFELAETFDEMLDRLQRAFEEEKQFTSDVSHELRTPIAVIQSQVEYALEDEEYAKEGLEVILTQTKKLTLMIQQMLELSRAEQGSETIQKEYLDISELVEMVSSEMTALAVEKGKYITLDIKEHIYFECDQTLIMRMLMNLITNAIHYGGKNINIILTENEKQIIGKVVDDGVGIEKEHQEKVFTRFYQVETHRNKNENGSVGLGLSMVKWIVEVHGGTINIESEHGKGTSFIFVFKK